MLLEFHLSDEVQQSVLNVSAMTSHLFAALAAEDDAYNAVMPAWAIPGYQATTAPCKICPALAMSHLLTRARSLVLALNSGIATTVHQTGARHSCVSSQFY